MRQLSIQTKRHRCDRFFAYIKEIYNILNFSLVFTFPETLIRITIIINNKRVVPHWRNSNEWFLIGGFKCVVNVWSLVESKRVEIKHGGNKTRCSSLVEFIHRCNSHSNENDPYLLTS